MANYKVADLKLADAGRLRIDWAETRMPVLMALREKGKKDKPLKGMRVSAQSMRRRPASASLRSATL